MGKERPVWIVRDCGVHFNDIKDWKKEVTKLSTQLSEEEKKSEYAKYYFREIKMPTHENLAAGEVENPLPRELAVRPEEYLEAMDSEKIEELRSGYYLFEDGIGFSMSKIILKDVNDEKFKFFNENFMPEGDLYYKCWYPGMHVKHYIQGCIEDVGLGMELINFLSGYSLDEFCHTKDYSVRDPLFINFNGGGGVSWPLHAPFTHPRYALQTNWWREWADGSGRELYICFWHGVKWENGQIVRTLPEGEKVNIEYIRSHMNHSIWEYTQTEKLINDFWEDHKNRKL